MKTNTIRFMLAVLLAFVAQGSIWYTMPLLFAKTLSNNYFDIGLLVALIPLIEIAAAVPFGYFADFGRIKSIAFSSMLALAVVPLLFATGVNLLNGIGVFMLAMGGIGLWIAATAYVSNVMGKRGVRYIGYEFAVMEFGWAAGPMLGGFIYSVSGNAGLALAEIFIFAISSFIFMGTLNVETRVKQPNAPKLASVIRGEKRVFKAIPKFVFALLLMGFLYTFFSYAVWVFIPLLTLIQNAGIFVGGIVTGVVYLPNVIGDLIGGRMYKAKNERKIIAASLLVAMVTVLATALLLQESYYALLILFISALAISVADVGVFGATIQKDKKDSGEIAALSVITGGIGGALGSFIAGATVATYALYIFAAIFSVFVLAYIAYLYVQARRPRF